LAKNPDVVLLYSGYKLDNDICSIYLFFVQNRYLSEKQRNGTKTQKAILRVGVRCEKDLRSYWSVS
jgi:hypothetical protein